MLIIGLRLEESKIEELEYIVTFFTHFGAIKFGRFLEQEGICYNMMPVPRKLSSSCGTCVRFKGEIAFDMREDEEVEGFYCVEGHEYRMILEKE